MVMEYRRVLAVGDIHGEYQKLLTLYDKIKFNPVEDLLVFLGDYIDRGPESLKCLLFVWKLKLKYPERVVVLLGNHEAMLMEYFSHARDARWGMPIGGMWDCAADDTWKKYNGGASTAREIRRAMRQDPLFLGKLLRFLQGSAVSLFCLTSHEMGFIFAHGGIVPGCPIDEQPADEVQWIREECYKEYTGQVVYSRGDVPAPATLVIGHTPVTTLDPEYLPVPIWLTNGVILCDTGSYFDFGRLSCVDVVSEHRNYWQA